MKQDTGFGFEKLQVYQKAVDIIDTVYEYTNSFPKEEMYGITSQFRRAAVSISLNIAEGSARSKKDFRRFLDIAQGSIYECVTLLTICKRRNYIKDTCVMKLRECFVEQSKMTCGLKKGIGFAGRNES